VLASEYERLFIAERTHWWFRGLRAALGDELRRSGLSTGDRLLDAGCGTGGTLAFLEREAAPRSFGLDLSDHALRYSRERGLERLSRASVNDLPFRSGTLDAVVSIDVLESREVRERRAYAEMWRVVRPGGLLAILVPACPLLASEGHDRAVHAGRRYTAGSLARLLGTRPVRVRRITHLFGLVFPAVAAFRVAGRCLWGRPARPRSELFALPRLLNEALAGLMEVERRILGRCALPVGSSLLAVATKEP
jgi:SAM-dependent methyltransferase